MLLQKNRIPLKTSSCGMFLENNIFLLISHEPLFEGGESGDVKDHGSPRARSLIACYRRDARRGKGSASHTKTLMERASSRNQLHPLGRSISDRLLPKGRKKGQRLCEPYQNLDGESQLSESTTSPCQRLARGLGSGLKPLLMKKGLGLMEVLQASACNGVWGYPPARGNTSLRVHPEIIYK